MARREAYLEALGLTDWVRRDGSGAAPEAPRQNDAPAPQPAAAPAVVAAPVASETEKAPVEAQPEPAAQPAASAASASSAPSIGAPQHRSRVLVGPGSGSCLYLCGPDDDESTPLASDLARVLATPPVWGRLADASGAQPLELIIAERLFTHVIVFGEASAQRIFGGDAPETCGPARVIVVDDLARLAGDAGARRSCWAAMKATGVVSVS